MFDEDDYFSEEEQDQYDYMVALTIDDIRLIHHSVQETIKYWPGAPARPYDEQERLWALRDNVYRMMLDYQFREM
jgi:hypothetical protein